MFPFASLLMLTLPALTYMSVESSYRYLPDNMLHVTSVLLEPYLMPSPDYTPDNGLPQFSGYIPDLLTEISRIIALGYVIHQAPDNNFGYRTADGSWNGMIGQIARQEAQVAAAPMYVTSQRARTVDFTLPFLHVEATLLLRKPPRGAELTIRSVEDLINQSEIKYGTLDRGVLIREYRTTNSTALRLMFRNMQRFEPTTFTETNEEGIAKVRSEKYAFVLPHTIGEYMANQEPCDLVVVDRFLMKRGYSLAVQKDSPLLGKLNWAIRTLEENGKLLELYRKWWFEKSPCRGRSSKLNSGPARSGVGRGLTPAGLPGFVFLVSMVLRNILCALMNPS